MLNSFADGLLVHAKLGMKVCLAEQGWAVLGCYSTNLNSREPNLRVDSVGDLWGCLCGDVAPNSLHRELEMVMVLARLDHRVHLTHELEL